MLFRGNAEAVIRRNLVKSGMLKGIIGLPANQFYGTGIPACILVLDKENATARKGVFLIDASKGFRKDGNKTRLREQDIHKIVDTFRRQDESDPRYARMVPFDEIADPKNDFNLNFPRYIDGTEPEDLQDIDGHLRGGIPDRDLDAFTAYWKVLPSVRATLFTPLRPGYQRLQLPLAEVKAAILGHAEFADFTKGITKRFEKWKRAITPELKAFDIDGAPQTAHRTALRKPARSVPGGPSPRSLRRLSAPHGLRGRGAAGRRLPHRGRRLARRGRIRQFAHEEIGSPVPFR